jgi:hypothetical protein
MPLPQQPRTQVSSKTIHIFVIVIIPHFTRHLALALALYIPFND